MLAVCASTVLITCGGGGGGTTPTPNPNPTNPNTITITSAGVSPQVLQVKRGTQVRFVNNDTRAHDMGSDPHPEHTDCPEFVNVGVLNPGQSRETANLNVVRTCGFHDHNLPDNQSLKGRVIIR